MSDQLPGDPAREVKPVTFFELVVVAALLIAPFVIAMRFVESLLPVGRPLPRTATPRGSRPASPATTAALPLQPALPTPK